MGLTVSVNSGTKTADSATAESTKIVVPAGEYLSEVLNSIRTATSASNQHQLYVGRNAKIHKLSTYTTHFFFPWDTVVFFEAYDSWAAVSSAQNIYERVALYRLPEIIERTFLGLWISSYNMYDVPQISTNLQAMLISPVPSSYPVKSTIAEVTAMGVFSGLVYCLADSHVYMYTNGAARIVTVTFSNMALYQVHFDRSHLFGVWFRWVELSNPSFTWALAERSNWYSSSAYGGTFQEANFRNSLFTYVTFRSCSFAQARFWMVYMNDVYFENSNLFEAAFGSIDYMRARFVNCDVRGAYFDDIDAISLEFTNCNLAGAYITYCNLSGLTLNNCNIKGTTFQGSTALPWYLNTKEQMIASCGLHNVDEYTTWIDGSPLLESSASGTDLSALQQQVSDIQTSVSTLDANSTDQAMRIDSLELSRTDLEQRVATLEPIVQDANLELRVTDIESANLTIRMDDVEMRLMNLEGGMMP